MLRALRLFLREMMNAEGRFRLYFALIRNCPGEYGVVLRRRLLAPHFGSVGENLRVLEGVHFRNIQNIRAGKNFGIGDENFIQAGGGLEVGDNVVFGPGVKIWTQNHRFDDPDLPVLDQGAEYHKVVLGDDVWIGANAFIMPGVHLPHGCVVSAGAVVGTKQYKEYSILAGNPARVIGFRNAVRKATEASAREHNN